MNTLNENCTVHRDEGHSDRENDNDSAGNYLGVIVITYQISDFAYQ
jgi:hypothetical protein